MTIFSRSILIGSLMLASCQGLRQSDPDAKAAAEQARNEATEQQIRREQQQEARAQLDQASTLIKAGKLNDAQAILTILTNGQFHRDEAARLLLEINHMRSREATTIDQAASERFALFDVESRLRLPESYGQTVTISRDSPPRALPSGAMEELVKRKVSMHLDNAMVRDIIMALSKIEGLNIIADQTLMHLPPAPPVAVAADAVAPPPVAVPPTLTIHVDNLPLNEILHYIARNMGIAFHISADAIWVTASDKPAGAGAGPEMETKVYHLHHGLIPTLPPALINPADKKEYEKGMVTNGVDQELEEALKAFLAHSPPDAMFRIFPHRNLLVVRNTRHNLRLVEELIEQFDVKPLQVLIEARFITISQADLLRLGFSFDQLVIPANGTKVGFGDLAASPTVKSVVTTTAGKETEIVEKVESNMSDALSYRRLEASGAFPGTLTLSGILGNTTYIAVLDALKQVSSAKTLSVPRITVANNHNARIHRGTKRYYFEEYTIETIDRGDQGIATKLVPTGRPREIDLGYQLEVKVNIGNNGETIMLALKPKINDISGYEFFDTAKLPILDENTLQTTVVVNSGETVVLGGMMTKSETNQEKRIPVIGNIPIIGSLFRTRIKENAPHHLLIFVNATVIDGSGRLVLK